MGGGIGTADEPLMAPPAPEFGQLHEGGWPLTLPPGPGSGLFPVERPDVPDLERAYEERSPVGGSEGEDNPEPEDESEDE